MKKLINVTQAIHPNRLKYIVKHLKLVNSHWYTNDGKYLKELENRLREIWKVSNVVVMANGTLPLTFLMEQLPKGSNVLTTPFSFVATASSIKAAGHNPIFVDLSQNEVHVDLNRLESEIVRSLPNAVLLTHVYGTLPDTDALEKLSIKYQIPIFYDASHSFGVNHNGRSAVSYGAASTISFHATKIFSTVEGGALITNDNDLAEKARAWRNFGIEQGEIRGLGINAKMSEFHALFGLELLPSMEREISRRRKLMSLYQEIFSGPDTTVVASPNGSYIPVIFKSEQDLLAMHSSLLKKGIVTRRYFYPSLDSLEFLQNSDSVPCTNSRNLAPRVLCMPIGKDVNRGVLERIRTSSRDRDQVE